MSYIRKIEYRIVPDQSFEIRINANGNKLDVWLIYQCGK